MTTARYQPPQKRTDGPITGTEREAVLRLASEEPSPLSDEIAALSAIEASFRSLDSQAQSRVMAWAQSRYSWELATIETVMKLVVSLLEHIDKHQRSVVEPRQEDVDLWDATLKGSKYYAARAVSGGTP